MTLNERATEGVHRLLSELMVDTDSKDAIRAVARAVGLYVGVAGMLFDATDDFTTGVATGARERPDWEEPGVFGVIGRITPGAPIKFPEEPE